MTELRSAGSPLRIAVLCTLLLCAGCGKWAAPRIEPERNRLEAADLALARGDFDRASLEFEWILERDPDHLRALLGSARANLGGQRGAPALARFAAYRARGGAWQKLEQWEYCSALALGSQQALESSRGAGRALALARRLESEECGAARALIERSSIAVADAARRAGRAARALEVYLSLVSDDARLPQAGSGGGATGRLGQQPRASVRARAYLAAAELLVEAERREEALVLLSRGLGEFPGNRDLVQRMVAVLADAPATAPAARRLAAPE